MSTDINNSITIQSLEYKSTATSQLFNAIEHQPWAMLLRSASNAHVNSRFDILVADPIATLTTTGNISTIYCPTGKATSKEDPFTLLKQLQETWLPSLPAHPSLPFLGGAVGYWGYDLGRRIETLPQTAEHDITAPDMAIGLYDWAIIADHKENKLWQVNLNPTIDRYTWLKQQVPQPKVPFQLTGPWQSNMTRNSYGERFNAVKEYIFAGDCYQINLAQRFQAPYIGSEWSAYRKLEHANQAPFSAFIRLAEHSILSISPERFLSLQQGKIETKPIKGTRPRYDDPSADEKAITCLQNTEKDRAENLMIVDLLRNDIGRVASPGSVKVPELFAIESFPAVHHLVSTVTGVLSPEYEAADLLRAAFPGGSITGAPKIRAMEIIEEIEPHRRSIYCGSIGYISNCGNMDSSITIRTLISQNDQFYAWAGGGLVADSEVNSEYQEIRDKLSRILPLL
ncbi:aminodeoxychorismate synthase component 1 [Thaumasiovibrio sp. DFM-14]|uniref:aminodeoxychorismate synthase component 1 n=1 Tax=Thaumasiovibrio sp. DFM-14 TaxID=3384792 RepID=UPI0039A13925